jgi:hypothetical protein
MATDVSWRGRARQYADIYRDMTAHKAVASPPSQRPGE